MSVSFITRTPRLKFHFLIEVSDKLGYGHAHLFHGVAVADGHALVVKRVEVDGVPISSWRR